MTKELSLFTVVDTKTNRVVKKGFGKEQKPEAKKTRDELNEKKGSKGRYVVSRGPDHVLSKI